MIVSRLTRTKEEKTEINSSIVIGTAVMFGEVVSAQQRFVWNEANFGFGLTNFVWHQL